MLKNQTVWISVEISFTISTKDKKLGIVFGKIVEIDNELKKLTVF